MHVIAAKAVAFKEAMEPSVRRVPEAGRRTTHDCMAGVFLERGYNVVSGGTDNHLFLVDLIGKPVSPARTRTRPSAAANITVNKNAVPNDPRSPFVTSGLRIGTPAITTRGFGETECRELTGWMCDVLEALEQGDAEPTILEVRARVLDLCARFPVYGDRLAAGAAAAA
jgi:glycine hydroxymethyltransferase